MTHTKAAMPSDASVWAVGTLNVLLADNTSTPKPIAVTFKEASPTKNPSTKKGSKRQRQRGPSAKQGAAAGLQTIAGQ